MADSEKTRCFGCAALDTEESMVKISDRWLCRNCKAAYEQKLREGVADDFRKKRVTDLENCPYCEEPLNHGFLRGTISWSDSKRSLFPKLEPLSTEPKPGFFSLSISMQDTQPPFEAVRCNGCGLIMTSAEPNQPKKKKE